MAKVMPMPTKFDGEKSIIALMANKLIKYIIVIVVDKSGIRTYKTLFYNNNNNNNNYYYYYCGGQKHPKREQ